MLHILALLGCAVVIYVACEWFVNGIEWLGAKLNLGSSAVGSVLAAIGTALPESVVTLVAVTAGGASGKEIGIGAAMGGPLALATIGYGVVGVMVLLRVRRMRALAGSGLPGPEGTSTPAPALADPLADIDTRRLARDQTWFLSVFALKVALGLVVFAIKPVFGLVFLLAYAVFTWRELRSAGGHDVDEVLEPLKLTPRAGEPATWAVLAQVAATLVLIFAASQVFVGQLDWAGEALGLAPAVVALLLAPLATELPEVMNAIIWVRQGKTSLALANISGSMMIQGTVPSALGLFFTPWHLSAPLIVGAVATAGAIGYLLLTLRAGRFTGGRLAMAALFYVGFAAILPFVL